MYVSFRINKYSLSARIANLSFWKTPVSMCRLLFLRNDDINFIKNSYLLNVMVTTLLKEYSQKKWNKNFMGKLMDESEEIGWLDQCCISIADTAKPVCICRSALIGSWTTSTYGKPIIWYGTLSTIKVSTNPKCT